MIQVASVIWLLARFGSCRRDWTYLSVDWYNSVTIAHLFEHHFRHATWTDIDFKEEHSTRDPIFVASYTEYPSVCSPFFLSEKSVTIQHTPWYKGIVTHNSNTLLHILQPPIRHHRNPYGNVRKHLVPYDPVWHHTDSAITAWHHLVPRSTTSHPLPPVGTTRHQLGHRVSICKGI